MAKRLLLEGPDDKHVIECLLCNHGLEGAIHYKPKEGIENLLRTLEEEIQATDADRLGIVIDADTDLGRQWARVVPILTRCGYLDVPTAPDPRGTIVESAEGQRLGVWIMPDNVLTGALEDFVARLIDEKDDLWPKAKADVDAIPEASRRYKPTYHSKAQIHTWLAWQAQPGTRMGAAFQKQYLDPSRPQAKAFVAWIRRLLA